MKRFLILFACVCMLFSLLVLSVSAESRYYEDELQYSYNEALFRLSTVHSINGTGELVGQAMIDQGDSLYVSVFRILHPVDVEIDSSMDTGSFSSFTGSIAFQRRGGDSEANHEVWLLLINAQGVKVFEYQIGETQSRMNFAIRFSEVGSSLNEYANLSFCSLFTDSGRYVASQLWYSGQDGSLFVSARNYLETYLFGGDSSSVPFGELVVTLVSYISVLAIIALPFVILWIVIRRFTGG